MMKKISLPSWDLSGLFAGLNDPKIKRTQDAVTRQAKAFRARYQGKGKHISAQTLNRALQEYEAVIQNAAKPFEYAHLIFSADSQNPHHGAFLQKMKVWYQSIYEQIVFFELEIGHIPNAHAKKLERSPKLKSYRYFLERQAELKKHHLLENEEKILSQKSITGRSAFIRLYDEEGAARRVMWNGRPVSESQILNLLYDPKQATRKKASEAFTNVLKKDLRRSTFIYNTLIEDKKIDDRYRTFETPEASRHLDNQINQKIVDTMTGVVTDHFPLVQDFYRFKKKLMGVKTLYDYDRYAPVHASSIRFPFSESRTIVLDAFNQFSPEYAKLAQAFFDHKWIDAAARPGKRGGAFCMYTTPDHHPYVLVNFVKGDVKDVLTLAHELGHGVHASLARAQTPLNFDHPLTIAETASIFGEMLTFNALKHRVPKKKDQLALYLNKIEGIFASIFRQIAMYRFEQDAHRAVREQGEQTAQQFNALWSKRQAELFGSSITLTSNYDVWWSYIPHFIHTPFYVYAYAFGELLTLSLFAQYQKDGKAMVDRYMTLLRSGGSSSPQALLKPFGIDLTKKTFWEGGMKLLKTMIQEAYALADIS
ncbi:M3 family oligoendopeptidase [Candidatus Uhrbacteria bacterium]|nr:M3 family oligoendopeptidase [Candidatus Uhrbacteria bacterium]